MASIAKVLRFNCETGLYVSRNCFPGTCVLFMMLQAKPEERGHLDLRVQDTRSHTPEAAAAGNSCSPAKLISRSSAAVPNMRAGESFGILLALQRIVAGHGRCRRGLDD
jgi:hypothetical protein